ncbi:MAG: acetate--CoA ligase family protein [Nannocystaceae bacterium]
MEADARLRDALALLRGGEAPRGRIVASEAALRSGRLRLPAAEEVEERSLARLLDEAPPTIVAVDELTPTLLRALRRQPPALLVITGSVDEEGRAALAQLPLAVLGPEASLQISDGELLACAWDGPGLDDLVRELGAGSVGVALAPTPAWLVSWLDEPGGPRAIGFIGADALDTRWSRWIRRLPLADACRHVLVPLGVEPPRVETPRHPSLAPAVAAHALERATGPIYPSAPVVAAVAHGLAGSRRGFKPSPALLGRWAQARRALPLTGATPGMEAPHPGLTADDPGAAYLAQRALLRQERSLELVAGRGFDDADDLDDLDAFEAGDDAGRERSLEVLRSAGEVLSEHESKVVLHGFGIEVTRQAVASSASGAASFAEQIGFPVVLKAVSPDLRRKRELGAVVLDLTTAAAVRRAYASIVAAVEDKAPTAHLDGVLVAEQIAEGLELHCGAIRLDTGEVALYGRPIGLQAPQEQVLVASPLSADDALLFANAILTRVPVPALRRRSDPDAQVLAALFRSLDALVQECEERVLSIELQPVRLIGGERGYVTLDARIVQLPHLEGY